jgi:hypothetical protein
MVKLYMALFTATKFSDINILTIKDKGKDQTKNSKNREDLSL